MPSTASIFASNTLCLHSLGEQINNEALLYRLCLVSRLFHLEFTPFLYRHVAPGPDRSWSSLVSSPYLGYMRSLTVTSRAALLEETKSICPMDETVQQVVSRAPALEAFEWVDPGLLTQDIINRLRESCPKLRRLRVDYDLYEVEEMLDAMSKEVEMRGGEVTDKIEDIRRTYLLHDYSSFTGLEELSLNNIYGDPHDWVRRIVPVLLGSPNLRKLGLGVSADGVRHSLWENYFSYYENLFEFLCNEYASAGGSPLRLRSIRFGQGLCPTSLSALEKLTDLAYLEEVHTENKNVVKFRTFIYVYERFDPSGHSDIIFDALLSDHCPRLRRFSVAALRADVCEALCRASLAGRTAQLAVFVNGWDRGDLYTMWLLQDDSGEPGLPLRLRMLYLDLRGQEMRECRTFEEALKDLVASQSSPSCSLEGLAVRIPAAYAKGDGRCNGDAGTTTANGTTTNTTHNNNNNKKDDNVREFDLNVSDLLRILPNLSRLSQLAVTMAERGEGERDYVLSDESTARDLAERLVQAVPSLQYIAVGDNFWRVWRSGRTELEPLREMREVQAVELFAHAWSPPSRLEE